MNYFLIQLRFKGAVHFGSPDSALSLDTSEDHFRADTLFSALCHTALQQSGEAGIARLCRLAQQGDLLLSDSMIWQDDTYYLPKPCITPEVRREVPSDLRKAIKRLSWIPIPAFGSFADSLHGGALYQPEEGSQEFGTANERTFARVSDGEDTVPYPVGLYSFQEKDADAPHDSGLYVLLACREEADGDYVCSLMEALGLSGIGGKTSAGLGKFTVEDFLYLNEPFDEQTQWLSEALSRDGPASLLLTTSLPREEELPAALDGACCQLVRRSGFIASDCYAETARKKQTQYFLSAGAVLRHRFTGDLYNVGQGGSHPVYRYGKPLFLGVAL